MVPEPHDFNEYRDEEELDLFAAAAMLLGWKPLDISGPRWAEDLESLADERPEFFELLSKIAAAAEAGDVDARTDELGILTGYVPFPPDIPFPPTMDAISIKRISRGISPWVNRESVKSWASRQGHISIEYEDLLSRSLLPAEALMWLLFEEHLPPTDEPLQAGRPLGAYRYKRDPEVQKFWEALRLAVKKGRIEAHDMAGDGGKTVPHMEPLEFFEFARQAGQELPEPIERLLGGQNREEVRLQKPKFEATQWSQVFIDYPADGRVAIRVNSKSVGRYNFTQMGMVNKRTDKPNRAWEALEKCTRNHGVILVHSSQHSAVKQRVKRLSRCLKEFFGIDVPPFSALTTGLGPAAHADGSGWKANFNVPA